MADPQDTQGELFGAGVPPRRRRRSGADRLAELTAGGRVVRVLPDQPAVDKEFDYVVPDGVAVAVGDVVRVPLHGRFVGGWVTAVDVAPEPGVVLRPVRKVSGRGPAPELLDLAGWAAWRWAGRRAQFLRTAAPDGVVASLPRPLAVPRPLGGGTAAAVGGRSGGTGSDGPAGGHRPRAGGRRGDAEVDRPAAGRLRPDWIERALGEERGVLRLAPGADRYAVVRAAVAEPGPVPGGRPLVLCPSVAEAEHLARRLAGDGVGVAPVVGPGMSATAAARVWAQAAAGAVVVGARAAAWAPVAGLGRVVVLDEHDERYQQEQAPTWHAREVVIERARRAGAPCLLVSPCPSLEALAWGSLVTTDRPVERAGWPPVVVVDQRERDPQLGPLFSEVLVRTVGPVLAAGGRVVCVLNRTGRVRLLACASCRTIARCEVCDAAVGLDAVPDPAEPSAPRADQLGPGEPPAPGVDPPDPADPSGGRSAGAGDAPPGDGPGSGERAASVAVLACPRCGATRPTVCLECGGSRFANLRLGVSRAREELEALVRQPVGEVTAGAGRVGDERVLIGTEAVLHRVPDAALVAFLDMDQHLLAPRYRAGEDAFALLARAARLVARSTGRRGAAVAPGLFAGDVRGRVLVQTRHPDHPVLRAAMGADPSVLAEAEAAVRRAVGLPPFRALALVSGPGAAEYVEALRSWLAADSPDRPAGPEGPGLAGAVEISGPSAGTWRLAAPDHATLCDTLAAVRRPSARLRVEVDPLHA